MVGEGVLLECLVNPAVSEVLLVSRKAYEAEHPKLKQVIAPDFFRLNGVYQKLGGYDACFFCAGVSSAGMKELEYTYITYDMTMHFAETLVEINPRMTFVYVSGTLTDSTEQGRSMWARVKGRTENALMRLPFAQVFNFRPGFMRATPGQKHLKWTYRSIGWMYPILRAVAPNVASTLQDVAVAMIKVATRGYPKRILEVKDINALARS